MAPGKASLSGTHKEKGRDLCVHTRHICVYVYVWCVCMCEYGISVWCVYVMYVCVYMCVVYLCVSDTQSSMIDNVPEM